MERIFSRPTKLDPTATLKNHNDFIESLKGLPIAEAEQRIDSEDPS